MRLITLFVTAMVSFSAYGGTITSTNLIGKHIYWLASNGALLRAVVTDVQGTVSDGFTPISDIKFEVRPDIDGTHPDDLPPVSPHEPRFDLEGREYDSFVVPTVPRNDTDGGSWTEVGKRWRGTMMSGSASFFAMESGDGYTIEANQVVPEGFFIGKQVRKKRGNGEVLGTVVGLHREGSVPLNLLNNSSDSSQPTDSEQEAPVHPSTRGFFWRLIIDKTNAGVDIDDLDPSTHRDVVLASAVEAVE